MRYQRRGRSGNLEDRRGGRLGAIPAIGGIGGVVVFLLVQLLGGGDGGLGEVLGQLVEQSSRAGAADGTGIPEGEDPDADQVEFVSFVLDDTQAFWAEVFASSGRDDWRDARLVIFDDAVQSGCGHAPASMGPFYCSADERAYLDLSFFNELHRRFGAPGDFAQAYVLAHEIGHHVQHVLGISADVRRRVQAGQDDANDLSVRQELQADCFSGLWASTVYARGDLEAGDLQEGLDAAEAIGDDRLQHQAGAEVDPESWTHGSSEQRQRWFRRGFDTGDPAQCDTFAATEL